MIALFVLWRLLFIRDKLYMTLRKVSVWAHVCFMIQSLHHSYQILFCKMS